MEALASTRLIHSSAFACRATEETHVRKVRGRHSENAAHIQMGLHGGSYHALFVHMKLFVCNLDDEIVKDSKLFDMSCKMFWL